MDIHKHIMTAYLYKCHGQHMDVLGCNASVFCSQAMHLCSLALQRALSSV